jgi:hypothetical protein
LVAALLAYAGSRHHPDVAPPTGARAETNVIDTLQPADDRDERLIGDLVIERLYAIDLDTGQQIIADLCKGRIQTVTSTLKYDWTGYTYAIELDRSALQGQSSSIGSIVAEAAPPDIGDNVKYAGLRLQPGVKEKIQVNYVGVLPDELVEFVGPHGEDEFGYLSAQTYAAITRAGPQFIDIENNRFLLSNTEYLPAFRDLFGVRRAVILARLLLVDATSAEAARNYGR